MPQPARTLPAYRIELPVFSGPLDLLLHLIEREELDVTVISLTRVTEQYLEQVEQLKNDKIDHMIDFLVIGARLVLIKSRALLPQPPGLPPDEEVEDPAEALIRQLKQYKRFKRAAAWLQEREQRGLRTHLRVAPPPRLEGKLDISGINADTLYQTLWDVLTRVEEDEERVEVIQPRRVTIEGQVQRLLTAISVKEQVTFKELLSPDVDRIEVAVTLLAMLELIKRREVTVRQQRLFGPIEIRAANDRSDDTPPTP
ncbi:MAG: segregation and condensation protein A [Chloroflexota bacterium]